MKETKQMKIMSIFIYNFGAWDWTISSINNFKNIAFVNYCVYT